MNIRMEIEHVQSGRKWIGEASDFTSEELEEAKQAIKENIKHITYVELGTDILPGDFIRNYCVIRFVDIGY
jgi:hypothetical protein